MSLVIERGAAADAVQAQGGLALVPLCALRPGCSGHIIRIAIPQDGSFGIPPDELERRLLEIGFTEGASVEVLHEGLLGRDPIVVLVDGTRIALRRREAQVILVKAASAREHQ